MISLDTGDPSVLGSPTDVFFLRGHPRGVGWIRGEGDSDSAPDESIR